MDTFDIIAWLLLITALFSYLNHRFLHFPTSIGVMAISLLFSLGVLAVGKLGWLPHIDESAKDILVGIDFNQLILHGILGALLFAGALHINLADLAEQKWTIALLATAGILISTALVGGMIYGVTQWLSI